jgi:hypothetical protein
MAQFAVGQPITTTTPTIVVDAGLAVGSHRFQLVVVDSSGLRSAADVQVIAVQRPVIVVPPVGPVGPVVNPVGPVVNPVTPGVTPVTPVRPAVNPVITPADTSVTPVVPPRKPTA